MKALSIRQPWASAILFGGKRLENRDWKGCSYRGPILLHAAKTLVFRSFDEDVDAVLDIMHPAPGVERLKVLEWLAEMHVPLRGKYHGEGSWKPPESMRFGGIVGRARIVDVVDPDGGRPLIPAVRPRPHVGPAPEAWHAGGFALLLADVEPLPFVPFKGSLGFFDVPDHLIQEPSR